MKTEESCYIENREWFEAKFNGTHTIIANSDTHLLAASYIVTIPLSSVPKIQPYLILIGYCRSSLLKYLEFFNSACGTLYGKQYDYY